MKDYMTILANKQPAQQWSKPKYHELVQFGQVVAQGVPSYLNWFKQNHALKGAIIRGVRI